MICYWHVSYVWITQYSLFWHSPSSAWKYVIRALVPDKYACLRQLADCPMLGFQHLTFSSFPHITEYPGEICWYNRAIHIWDDTYWCIYIVHMICTVNHNRAIHIWDDTYWCIYIVHMICTVNHNRAIHIWDDTYWCIYIIHMICTVNQLVVLSQIRCFTGFILAWVNSVYIQ